MSTQKQKTKENEQMSDCEKAPMVAAEWSRLSGQPYRLTNEQRRRMRNGKSIYERDKVVEKYDVKKGKWV